MRTRGQVQVQVFQRMLFNPTTLLLSAAPAEPLDNLDSVMAAVEIMTHPLGLHMSKQKVSIPRVLHSMQSTHTA